MLIRKPRTIKMKLTIELPMEAAKMLDQIRTRAKADGAEIDLSGAVADFLVKKIRAVEKQMDEVAAGLGNDDSSMASGNS